MSQEEKNARGEEPEHRRSAAGNFLARRLGVTGPWPWVTTVACTTMIVVFVALWLTPNPCSDVLGYYELAVDAYEISLKDKPNETWVLGNLVRVQWAVGKKDAASAALLKIRALDADMATKLEAELANQSH